MRSILVLALIFAADLTADTSAKVYFYEPSISPVNGEIAFVSGGDIWTVAASGGEARLLISNPANDSRPLFSPDGKQLAFMSNRTGNEDIFILTLASGAIKRITYDDSPEHLDAWSRDGKYLYFSSTTDDIGSMNDIFRIPVAGGSAMPVTADRFAAEYWAAPSPVSDAVAFTAKGTVAGQWWRRGHSHLDESQLWLVRSPNRDPKYECLDAGESKEAWPMWSADGKRIYFMSDRSGSENLWLKDVGGPSKAQQITNFKNGRLLWPNISYDGKTIVFEREFGIWKLDTTTNKASAVDITLRGAPAGPEGTRLAATSQFRDLILSPDGKKIAFVSHGEVFAGSSHEPGAATRVSNTPGSEFGIVWAPDSRKIVYVSDRDTVYHLYEYDFLTSKEIQLTHDSSGETSPRWAPDGKTLGFIRDGKDIIAYDIAAKQEHVLVSSHFSKPPQDATYEWSPDSQWIAYSAPGEREFRNIYVIPAAGGKAEAISFLANTNARSIAWTPDGTSLLFTTSQRTEISQVVRVDLIPKTPPFREDRFRDLFKDEPERPARVGATASPKPPAKVRIEFAGIRRRLHVTPVGVDANSLRISPDGKMLLLSATSAGQANLYTYPIDENGTRETNVARQLTSTPGMKANPQWSPDGKEIFFLEGGRPVISTLETRLARPLAVTAEMDLTFSEEKLAVFHQAWRYLSDNFFDSKFNGVNWSDERGRYEPYIAGSHTPDEERRIISLMIGDLNSSHSGISFPEIPPPPAVTGRLGLRFDPTEYDASNRFHITEVISLSPADIAGLKKGQYLEAIDGSPIVNLDEALAHKVDRRVVLTIADVTGRHEVPVRPTSRTVEKQLLYRHWVESRRDYVEKISNGKLGYVHMADMSQQALDQLYLDLDSANQTKQGVVIDIRNNNGGFVNAYALDVTFTKTLSQYGAQRHGTSVGACGFRPTLAGIADHIGGEPALPFGCRRLYEGYRTLKLGKVVGEPTAGWIIYTSNYTLIDGSSLRIPFTRITTAKGEPMEMHPRPVDIAIERPIGESYGAKDTQLDVAVKELLSSR